MPSASKRTMDYHHVECKGYFKVAHATRVFAALRLILARLALPKSVRRFRDELLLQPQNIQDGRPRIAIAPQHVAQVGRAQSMRATKLPQRLPRHLFNQ